MEAGTNDSTGPIQNPCIALAATNDAKLFPAAHQKQVTINMAVVNRYIGRFPIFTARALKIKLPNEMVTSKLP